MTSTREKPEVIVVGCGVSGLSCAIRLLEQQFKVTIMARDLPPNTTSNVAAAIWYPYKVQPQTRALGWGQVSLEEFYRLAVQDDCGVSLITLIELFAQPVEDPWWKEAVRQFSHTPVRDLPLNYQAGYTVEIPLIETPVYMNYLLSRFEQLGGQIEQRQIQALSELHQSARLIINCTGLGARDMTRDQFVYPIRGQIVRVKAPSVKQVLMDEAGPLGLLYIIPRRDGCILGGTAEENDWRLEVDPQTAQTILDKCGRLEPALREADILEHAVGLRPGRTEVRLELEPVSDGCAIIHNYGHGGAGFTLSWGCAEEVVSLARLWHLS